MCSWYRGSQLYHNRQVLQRPFWFIGTHFKAAAHSLQITNGPKYQLLLSGSGYKPKLHFSFLKHNFGPCHVWQQGMTPSSVVLTVQNQDAQPVSLDVLFDNTDNWQVWPECSAYKHKLQLYRYRLSFLLQCCCAYIHFHSSLQQAVLDQHGTYTMTVSLTNCQTAVTNCHCSAADFASVE